MSRLMISGIAAFMMTLGSPTSPSRAAEKGEDAIEMDITDIALFTSGVGYFCRGATVDGNASVTLSFRAEQINDILKSLVVQDRDGGRVGIVSYASQDPISKTLESFGVDITGKPSLADLLSQLRGEPVRVKGLRQLEGVILGIERHAEKTDVGLIEHQYLNLLTTEGLQRVDLASLQNIELTNEKVRGELAQALAVLAAAHDADKKNVTLEFRGRGQRRVQAAYLLETPVWKTSYRLVLSDDEAPLLQGWALVDNPTEEDWENVRLSLVAGRPISFVMDLYTPLYNPRPEEELELHAALRPPEHEGGFAAERRVARMERKELDRGRRGGRGGRAPQAAMADELYSGGVDSNAAVLGERAFSSNMELARESFAPVASGGETGELFQYTIETPVSIARRHAAMLPIVQEDVAAEKVSIYNRDIHGKHPTNAIELTNETSLHLMAGPITLFDGNAYAGDAKLPDLRPNEKRLLSYALDLGLEVMTEPDALPKEVVSISIKKGVLHYEEKYVFKTKYIVKNKTDDNRTLLIELPSGDALDLVKPEEPYEKTPGLYRLKYEVPADTTESYDVEMQRIKQEVFGLRGGDVGQIEFFLRTNVATPEQQRALEHVIALRTEYDRAVRRKNETENAIKRAYEEQERIRRNLSTLPRQSEQYDRQLEKFGDVETEIENLRAQLEEHQKREAGARHELENYIMSLEI